MRSVFPVVAWLSYASAENVAFSPEWSPPKCASWCHWEPAKSCLVSQCADCEMCTATKPSQSTAPTCAEWCNGGKSCSDSRCSKCQSCSSDAEPPEQLKCMAFCGIHHCKSGDQRCTGCELCGAKPAPTSAAGTGSQCPQWCSPTNRGHCGVDDRCDGCGFCSSKAGTTTSHAAPASVPSMQSVPPLIGDASCHELGPRIEVHRPTNRVSIVVSKWVDDATITLDFRDSAMELTFLQDGAHNHKWEPTVPPMIGDTEGVLAYHMHPLPKNAVNSPLEKLALTIVSDESVAWVEPKVTCASALWPLPPKPPPPPSPRASPSNVKLATTAHQAELPKAPLPEVLEASCETVTLKWDPPKTVGSFDGNFEYELAVKRLQSDSVLSTITTSDTTYTVQHLEGGMDFDIQVRARDPRHPLAGWGAHGSVTATTTEPSTPMAAPDAPSVAAATDEECTAIQLVLPELRRDCERETSLVLEYRVSGDS